MCFAVLMLVAVDATFLLLITHAAAQFKVLCAMLNDMHENISEVELNRTKQMSPLQDTAEFNLMKDPLTSADDITCHELGSGNSASRKSETAVLENCHMNKDPFQLYLAECIKHHQAIIEFVDHLNKIVSLATFLKVLNFPLLLCMTGFQMVQNVSDYEQFLAFTSLFAASLFLVGAYAWFGQQVIDEVCAGTLVLHLSAHTT
ncbi:hypothetical protein B7P43_G16859 [Cryptotermes secundus]|uniref:Odorant receptor n=1 Tax=Cryptotermes secundus TaxID=105785 RepID=A0A2J7PTK2_9NEOP|nr:hypothetical protein B7P43_G16859 [Cryptotermes secundus]